MEPWSVARRTARAQHSCTRGQDTIDMRPVLQGSIPGPIRRPPQDTISEVVPVSPG